MLNFFINFCYNRRGFGCGRTFCYFIKEDFMCILKERRLVVLALSCIFFFLALPTFSSKSLVDELKILPKNTYKRIDKLIAATSRKLSTDITVVIVQDEADRAEDNMANELLISMAETDKKYEGLLLLIVLSEENEVSALYLPSFGEKTEKIITEKRANYITDSVYDMALSDEKYEDGTSFFLKMLELFFEYGA